MKKQSLVLFASIIALACSVHAQPGRMGNPNFSGVITNYTRDPIRRVNFLVPVDFVNDLGTVQQVIVDALEANTHVLKAPVPSSIMAEMQEYTIQMRVLAYVKSTDYWAALPSIQLSVKDALDKAGVLLAVTRQAPVDRGEDQRDDDREDDQPERHEHVAHQSRPDGRVAAACRRTPVSVQQ